jgi:hypothetical protein
MSHANQRLSEQIEQLVRAHLEAMRREVAEAVARALSPSPSVARTKSARPQSTGTGGRRAPTELVALAEQLYELVAAQPGETMAVLAPAMGATPREMERPMKALRRAGRVRTVGQRHQTRYYPTVCS